MPRIDPNVDGVMITSSPTRSDQQQRPTLTDQRTANLRQERNIVLAEANQMADFALNAIRSKSGNVFQYQGYVNAIKERQAKMQRDNETILRPENFINENDYMQMRAQFGNDALNLDVKLIEIQHTINEMNAQNKERALVVESTDTDRRTRKLETLRLEKFNGTVESWLSFWRRFEERVHKNNKLTVMEKYDYLRQYCSSGVLNKLSTIPLTEDFYETAVLRLKNEFGSQERVMSHFTEKLLRVSTVQSRYDLDGLRALVQLVKSSTTALEGVGLTTDHVSPFFWPVLRKTLPVDLYLEFKTAQRAARSIESSRFDESSASTSTVAPTSETFKGMLDFLETICEDMSALDPEKLRQQVDRHRVQERSHRVPTLAALAVSPKPDDKNRKKVEQVCLFCKETKHRTEACQKEIPLDSKRQLLSQEKRCFRCTRGGHTSRECRTVVSCEKCQKKNHVSSLCRGQPAARNVNCCAGSEANSARNFMTVEALAFGPNGRKRTVRVLFDTAAEVSFANTEFVQALGIDLNNKPKTQIPIRMFNEATTVVDATKVEFRLQSKHPAAPKLWISCQAVNKLVEGSFKPQVDDETRTQLEQRNIRLADSPKSEKPIEVVIGLDHFVEFQTHNAMQLTKTLEVVETRLGWTLFGRRNAEVDGIVDTFKTHATVCLVSSSDVGTLPRQMEDQSEDDKTLEQQFRRFVEIDAFQLDAEKDEDERKFVEEFMKTVELSEEKKRFIVRLPFREGIVPSRNRNLCVARLRSLETRLHKSKMRAKYQAEFEEMIKLGFIEKVDDNQVSGKVVSYLPHREVVREDSLTTKLRIVFDASASEKAKRSLNEALWSGPNLTSDLLGILLNFRRYDITLQADIEKSFSQIIIHEEDRDALRLLWDFDGTGRPQEFRLTRNYFGLAPSPFILATCIRKLIDSYQGPYPEMVRQIGHSYYVDDLVLSIEKSDQATRMYEIAKALFAKGSFNLRKWFSNSQDLMTRFRKDDVSVEKFNCKETREVKVLGLKYDGAEDTLKVESPKVVCLSSSMSKRKVLSLVASVFDRLGMLAPVVLRAKLIMQDVYKIAKMRWDDVVPESIQKKVVEWSKDLSELSEVRIPRRYSSDGSTETKTEVHLFSDASVIAYGVVAYLVITGEHGKRSSSFLMAKTRVAPLKKTTIPRLELMGISLAAEACAFLRRHLGFKVSEYHLWTDSTSAFYQVTSQQLEKLPIFVRNRVTRIKELIQSAELRHVPGHLNPADLASRGCSVRDLGNSRWFVGPGFLREDASKWPGQPEPPKLVTAIVNAPSEKATLVFDSFSNWWKLKRSTAYALRFADFLLKKLTKEVDS